MYHRAGTHTCVHGKRYIYAWTSPSCCACLCMEGDSAAAAGTLPLGSPCALDMTAAICLLSSSLSWLRSASMPAGIPGCRALPEPPAPPAAAASPSGSPSPSKLASLPMARRDTSRCRSPRPPEPRQPGSAPKRAGCPALGARRRLGRPRSRHRLSRLRRRRPRPAAPPCCERQASRSLAPCLPVAASAPEQQPRSSRARPARRRRPRPAPRPLAAPALRVRRPEQVMSATPTRPASRRASAPGQRLKGTGGCGGTRPGPTADASFRHVAGCPNPSFRKLDLRVRGLGGAMAAALPPGICSFVAGGGDCFCTPPPLRPKDF